MSCNEIREERPKDVLKTFETVIKVIKCNCPSCGIILFDRGKQVYGKVSTMKYCQNCGQWINWENNL